MPRPRRILAIPLVVLALLAAGLLCGCAGGEEQTVAEAVAHSGLLGGLGEQLKREDDEAEGAELRGRAPADGEERREAREAQEAAVAEAQQPEAAGSEGEEAEEGPGGGEAD